MKFSKDPKVTNNFDFAGRRGWPAMVKTYFYFSVVGFFVLVIFRMKDCNDVQYSIVMVSIFPHSLN